MRLRDTGFRWFYWSGIAVFVVWTAFSAYSTLNGF